MIKDLEKYIRCWNVDYDIRAREQRREDAYKRVKDRLDEFGVKDLASWWNVKDFAILVDNQLLVEGEVGLANKDFGWFLSSLAAPLLCHTIVTSSWNNLVFYTRNRHMDDGTNVPVIESEEIVTKEVTIPLDETEFMNERKYKYALQMINEIDNEIIDDLFSNASTLGCINTKHFGEVILEVIDKMTFTIRGKIQDPDAKFWVLCHENLIPRFPYIFTGFEKPSGVSMTMNLRRYSMSNYTLYSTNLIDRDAILVGTNDYMSYFFTPHILAAPSTSIISCSESHKSCVDYAFRTSYGKKLLREGSKGLGTVKIHE